MIDLAGLMQLSNAGPNSFYAGQNQAQAQDTGNANIENTLSQIRERMGKLGMEQQLLPGRMALNQAMSEHYGALSGQAQQQTAGMKAKLPGELASQEAEVSQQQTKAESSKMQAAQNEVARSILSSGIKDPDQIGRAHV